MPPPPPSDPPLPALDIDPPMLPPPAPAGVLTPPSLPALPAPEPTTRLARPHPSRHESSVAAANRQRTFGILDDARTDVVPTVR